MQIITSELSGGKYVQRGAGDMYSLSCWQLPGQGSTGTLRPPIGQVIGE